MRNQPNWYLALLAAILCFGLYLAWPRVETVQAPNPITYIGVANQTALDLLKTYHRVETQTFDFGEMVVSINGQRASADEFWAFYINGEMATVGASSYQTLPSDNIEWRLEKIQ